MNSHLTLAYVVAISLHFTASKSVNKSLIYDDTEIGRKYPSGILVAESEKEKENFGEKPFSPYPNPLSRGPAPSYPESFDAREKWPQCESIGTVWDQGDCGSCWAVAAAGAISDRICIHQNKKVFVSAEELTSCGMTDCNVGGTAMQAWNYWYMYGLVTGGLLRQEDTCLPYSTHTSDEWLQCKQHCTNTEYSKSFAEDKHFSKKPEYISKTFRRGFSEKAIMAEILANGPVAAVMDVYEDFRDHYTSDVVYKYTWGYWKGKHMVKLFGWGTTNEDGVKYWLATNSWANWGDNGFFKIRKGVNECQIESTVVAANPRDKWIMTRA